MATYKVIQDIESEDKLLGPLTLRQFIYAVIVIIMGFISFKLATVSPFLVIPFILPMVFFGLLAAPFGHDQSSEVWILAKVRFFLKPRKRIWDQSGLQELVTITVPKKVEHLLTDGLSQTEVKSRLQALANTIDSRGWAVKNVNVNLSTLPSISENSDRLVDNSSLPNDVPAIDVLASDDMMDENNSPTAQHLSAMLNQSEQLHHKTLVDTMSGKAKTKSDQQPADYWFMNQPDASKIPKGKTMFINTTISPGMIAKNQVDDKGAEDQALLNKIHKDKSQPNPSHGHTKVLQPLGQQSTVSGQRTTTQSSKKDAHVKEEIARLANNNDLNISTISREANKTLNSDNDEVVISLR